jgi:hypothetical protein
MKLLWGIWGGFLLLFFAWLLWNSPTVWFFAFSIPVALAVSPIVKLIENTWAEEILFPILGWLMMAGTVLLMVLVAERIFGSR